MPTPFDERFVGPYSRQFASTVYVPQIGELDENQQGFLRRLFEEREERQATIDGSIGRNRFESLFGGVGPLSIDLTTIRIPSLGTLTPLEFVQGLATQGPDKFLGYGPYSQYSDFAPTQIGTLPGFNIAIGTGLVPSLVRDDGSVAVTAVGVDPETGNAYIKLSVVDTTMAGGPTGSHVVSGARYIWLEPSADGGYTLNNLGASRAFSPFINYIGEPGMDNLYRYNRESGSTQNANWRTFAEGVVQRVEDAGGSATSTFRMTTYAITGGIRLNQQPATPVRSGDFRFPSRYP